MKKTASIIVSTLLVLTLAGLSFGKAFATAPMLSDPMASPAVPGINFESQVLKVTELPGTFVADNGMALPVGFMGQAQFEGKGLQVSGLKAGEKVNLSFNFRDNNYEWAGSIYRWNGLVWMKVPTSVTVGKDGAITWASASVEDNSVYALIMGSYGVHRTHLFEGIIPPTEIPTELPPE
jgi:hypothetical protein